MPRIKKPPVRARRGGDEKSPEIKRQKLLETLDRQDSLPQKNAATADEIKTSAYAALNRVNNSMTVSDQAIALASMSEEEKIKWNLQASQQAIIAYQASETEDLLDCIAFAERAKDYVRKHNADRTLTIRQVYVNTTPMKRKRDIDRSNIDRRLRIGIAYCILLRHATTAEIKDNPDWLRWDLAQDCLPKTVSEIDRMMHAASPSKFVQYWEDMMRRSKARWIDDRGQHDFDEEKLHTFARDVCREKENAFKVASEQFKSLALLIDLANNPICGNHCACLY